jgi:hypothetical protein
MPQRCCRSTSAPSSHQSSAGTLRNLRRVSFERVEFERIGELPYNENCRPCRIPIRKAAVVNSVLFKKDCVKRYSVVPPEVVSTNSVSRMPGAENHGIRNDIRARAGSRRPAC